MKETLIRLLSGIVYVTILILAVSFSQNSFLVLFGVFMIISIVEFCNLINLNKTYSLIIGITLFLLFSMLEINKLTKFMLLFATLFVSIKLILSLFKNQIIKFDSKAKFVYLIGYLILPIIILTKISISNYTSLFQPRIIIGVFIIIWTNDTFAYIVGKSIGKNKLFEIISPKKTIEGFIGGLIFAVIAGILIENFYIQKSMFFWIITALIIGVFGTIGDLIESKFKRQAAVKDSGKIMPGHGGILDRLDSIIFAAPFIYLFLQIIQFF